MLDDSALDISVTLPDGRFLAVGWIFLTILP
jgi:hypothetical protein